MNGSPAVSMESARARTRAFSRVIGPFLAVIAAAAAVRAPQIWARAADYTDDRLLLWVAGAFTLLTGLIVVAFHPYWRGAAAFLVSAMGWLTVAKGVMLVAFPDSGVSIANAAMGAVDWARMSYVLFAVIGLYLTYVGWAPQHPGTEHESAGHGWHLRHAA